jgi:hypothetical protein
MNDRRFRWAVVALLAGILAVQVIPFVLDEALPWITDLSSDIRLPWETPQPCYALESFDLFDYVNSSPQPSLGLVEVPCD